MFLSAKMESTAGVGPCCLLTISFQDHQDANSIRSFVFLSTDTYLLGTTCSPLDGAVAKDTYDRAANEDGGVCSE